MTRTWTSLALLAVLLILAASPVLPQIPPDPAILPFSEVRPGLRGTGYTVLSGDTVSSFEAEVLGTVDQGAAQPRMIICRLSGAGFEQNGVLAAMSGSPIYVEGRLLGALAYAWPFAKEPVCGVTPAEDMVAIARGGAANSAATGPTTLADFFRNLDHARASSMEASPSGNAVPFPRSGDLQRLSDEGFAWSVDSGAGGAPAPAAPAAPPGPGGMIGVQLVSGDVQMSAYGTVTWVHGQDFLAFGHPFLNLGEVALPVVGARVIALVPSLARGFKLCAPGAPLGAVHQDRASGVLGRFGDEAPGVDVEAAFERPGLGKTSYRFRVAKHRQLTPVLLGGALNALWTAKEDPSAARTLALTGIVLQPESGHEVRLQDQTFSGTGVFAEAAEYVTSAVELLTNNPYEPVPLRSVRLSASALPGNRSVVPESAWLDRREVAPGDPLTLSVRLRPFQAPARIAQVDIPTADLPPGPVTLWVGGSFDVQKRLSASAFELPQSAPELVRFMADLPSDESLVVAAASPSPAKVMQGRRVGGLPPSMDAVLGASPSASAQDSPSRVLWRRSAPAGGPVEGMLELTLTVKEVGDHGP